MMPTRSKWAVKDDGLIDRRLLILVLFVGILFINKLNNFIEFYDFIETLHCSRAIRESPPIVGNPSIPLHPSPGTNLDLKFLTSN